MNPATVRRLARALRVPAKWLTGELDSLPLVPKHGLLSAKGPEEPEDLTEAKVRLSHLLARVDKALRRDLVDWYGDGAEAAYASWRWGMLNAIVELAMAVTWRLAAVEPKDGDPGVFLALRNTEALAWLEQALEPWLAGSAYLNARTLRELFLALVEDRQRQRYASQQTDADILRVLDLYATTREHAEHIKQRTTKSPRRSHPRKRQ
jgi:hypothetical protein